ncbi:hypothetical protein PMAYCL1PPCAC_04388, partial [Pristionchus mayeri]
PTVLLVLAALAVSAAGRKNALKTKKYKCIEVMEDEDELVSRGYDGWSKADEELRPIGSARLGAPAVPPPAPVIDFHPSQLDRHSKPSHYQRPSARVEEYTQETPAPKAVSSFISPMQPPKDSHGNPLVLSPQHCDQVKHYAGMYGVKDVLTWVKGNCAFAKMYLPSATCEEINILIASCYPKTTQRPRMTTTAAPAAPAASSNSILGGVQSLFGNWGNLRQKSWFW